MTSTPAVWPTCAHIYELDSLGHVNNANYLDYLQQATAATWGKEIPARWALRRLSMEHLAPALHGDELEVLAWPAGVHDDLACCGYAIRHARHGHLLLRARLEWAWEELKSGISWRSPTPWPQFDPDKALRVKPWRVPSDGRQAHTFLWRHQARGYEADASGFINPAFLLRWTEEARLAAAREVGWTYQRMQEADSAVVVVRHDGEFHAPVTPGDSVQIESRVVEMRHVRGVWRHEITCRAQIVAVDFVSGGFLSQSGRISPPPAALISALVGRAAFD